MYTGDDNAEEDGDGYQFDWDQENEGHIARHGVGWWEAEEVLLDEARQRVSQTVVAGERRLVVRGRTFAGRLLVVVYTIRSGKIRVVTARVPSTREVTQHRRRL